MSISEHADLHIDLQFYGLCEEAAGLCRFDLSVCRGEDGEEEMPVYVEEAFLVSAGIRIEDYMRDKEKNILEMMIRWYRLPSGQEEQAGCVLKKRSGSHILGITSGSLETPFHMRLEDSDLQGLAQYLRHPY